MMQDELKEWLHYDPVSGEFTWRKCKARWVTPGAVAGSIRADGYVEIGLFGQSYLAHRLAFLYMEGEVPELVDHIDQNRTNNTYSNLRAADRRLNAYNSKLDKRNTSGIRGVSWDKSKQKWVARFKQDGKYLCLGYFSSIEEAAEMRKLFEQGGS